MKGVRQDECQAAGDTLSADFLAALADVRGASVNTDQAVRPSLPAEVVERIEWVRRRTARARYRPRVACIARVEPLALAGAWIPEMVELCGGRSAELAAPVCDWESLVEAGPEVVIVWSARWERPDRGNLGDHVDHADLAQFAELAALAAHPRWRELPAVGFERVYAVDAASHLVRPGAGLVGGLELLAGLIQPGLCASRIPRGSYVRASPRDVTR